MKIFLTLLAFSSARTAKEAGSPNPKSMFSVHKFLYLGPRRMILRNRALFDWP